jgi:hypothetical protein
MKLTSIAIVIIALCGPAHADDFNGDNSACWDDNERQDISCTQLTDRFLMNMRFATTESNERCRSGHFEWRSCWSAFHQQLYARITMGERIHKLHIR